MYSQVNMRLIGTLLVTASLCLNSLRGEEDPFVKIDPPALTGSWDCTVQDGDLTYPSWFHVELSGYRTLVGSYVGQFGSARPISNVAFNAETGGFRFELPPQWEKRTKNVVVEGTLKDGSIKGVTFNDEGKVISFQANRAPSLEREGKTKWGKTIKLFNGENLNGWIPRHADIPNGWVVRDGLLINETPGNDIMTKKKFTDFKLEAEFRYPEGSNSGIYLRGRHEVQIEDNYGMEINSHRIGGVYGFLTPYLNAAKKPGKWQRLEITLIGRLVTIELNGKKIIERQNIPGITSGALDSDEGAPGPILVQGDHGPVEFRKLELTPAK
ncbi:MAG: DUF1080 domain-containing protein [Verrucomicrobia bacterium]|nr:DUF1080 domain-containing protein [Verrucomicrobiota bacterium]